MQQSIAIPAKSRAVLEQLIEQRERISGQIEAVLVGVRTALDVPDGWQIATLDVGFTPPLVAPAEGNGADQQEAEEGDPAPRS